MSRKWSRRSFVTSMVVGSVAASRGDLHTEPAGRVAGLDHVALPVQDGDAMIAFYRALGFEMTETSNAVSVYVGSQMINFHRPSLWQNTSFTFAAPAAKAPDEMIC